MFFVVQERISLQMFSAARILLCVISVSLLLDIGKYIEISSVTAEKIKHAIQMFEKNSCIGSLLVRDWPGNEEHPCDVQ